MKKNKIIRKFENQLNTLLISAFGLVAALSWNEAIQSLIQTFIPVGSEWPYKILNAVIITLIAVLVTNFLSN